MYNKKYKKKRNISTEYEALASCLYVCTYIYDIKAIRNLNIKKVEMLCLLIMIFHNQN